MHNGQSEYQAMQETVRRLHQEIGRIATEIAAQAESLRGLAEGAAAIGDRRMLSFGAVAEAAQERLDVVSGRPIRELIDKLVELEAAQVAATERYEQLTAEERVGQIPASISPK